MYKLSNCFQLSIPSLEIRTGDYNGMRRRVEVWEGGWEWRGRRSGEGKHSVQHVLDGRLRCDRASDLLGVTPDVTYGKWTAGSVS